MTDGPIEPVNEPDSTGQTQINAPATPNPTPPPTPQPTQPNPPALGNAGIEGAVTRINETLAALPEVVANAVKEVAQNTIPTPPQNDAATQAGNAGGQSSPADQSVTPVDTQGIPTGKGPTKLAKWWFK